MGKVRIVRMGRCSIGYPPSSSGLIVAIGILSAALVQSESGAVCLPAPNIVPAAVGIALDLIIDLYLVFQALKFLVKADEDSNATEFVVLISSVALLAWHFVQPLITELILEFYSDVI